MTGFAFIFLAASTPCFLLGAPGAGVGCLALACAAGIIRALEMAHEQIPGVNERRRA